MQALVIFFEKKYTFSLISFRFSSCRQSYRLLLFTYALRTLTQGSPKDGHKITTGWLH